MSSRNRRKTGRSDKEARHVRLYHTFMKSAAWKSLSANARAIYIEIAARYGGPGSNNGRLPYSVRDAAESLKIGKSTAADAIQQLQDRGFIVEVTKGGFNRKIRHATEWRLTEHSCDITDALPTRDYQNWSPKIHFTVPVAGPDGTCGRTIRYLQPDNEPPESAKNPPDGTCSRTLLVCQSVAPACAPAGASECEADSLVSDGDGGTSSFEAV